MATNAPTIFQPVTVASIERDKFDNGGDLANGQGLVMAAVGLTETQFEALREELIRQGVVDDEGVQEHPAVGAWESNVVDAAVAEIMPQVEQLLIEAIERRLPWTWER